MDRDKVLDLIALSLERDVLKVEELATECDVNFDWALRLVVKNWFDYQEKKKLEDETIIASLREVIKSQKMTRVLVDRILEKLESDRK
ncbi:hypothetical protein [Pleurocapsa sp. FMAR1]|uniref:hypothetical protein n=1 Tax=Pleurocapsa sp. FMAR1 TaxID=3040204 RepID=UPI0029C64835|nr:hypothetical protein [Pleurocapsa sp. FMAR1]